MYVPGSATDHSVPWIQLPEPERQTSAHHPHTVPGIHQRLHYKRKNRPGYKSRGPASAPAYTRLLTSAARFFANGLQVDQFGNFIGR